MLIYKKLLLFLSLPLLFSACKDDDERPDPPTQYMPQELKDYMLFETGSYWVYQDSATAALDSVVVTADTTFIHKYYDPEVNAVTIIQERYITDTYSFNRNLNYSYETALRCWYTGFDSQDFCYIVNRMVGGYGYGHSDMGFETCFLFYPKVGDALNSGYNIVSVGAINDSLQVVGQTYNYVVRMDDTQNGTEGGCSTRFYFSKHHGIIRKEINCPAGRKVWNLVRSQLMQ